MTPKPGEELIEEQRERVMKLRFRLMRKLPFYGDLAMNLPFSPRTSVPTACTDGRSILYNPSFTASLTDAELSFVILHEILHVIMLHPTRRQHRDPAVWNLACDCTVNDVLTRLSFDMKAAGIPISRPKGAVTRPAGISEQSAEALYMLFMFKQRAKARSLIMEAGPLIGDLSEAPEDEKGSSSPDGALIPHDEAVRAFIVGLLKNAYAKSAGTGESIYIPEEVLALKEKTRLNWKRILKDFLEEGEQEETSWITPERKYLHMDLILPGPGERKEDRLREIWAFADCSGSIGDEAAGRFLTELWNIARSTGCVVNLCWWDTEIRDVYMKIRRVDDILKSRRNGGGGTDVRCVYRMIRDKRLRPDVMILLTDGYFIRPEESLVPRSLARKTVVVLTSDGKSDGLERLGRIASL